MRGMQDPRRMLLFAVGGAVVVVALIVVLVLTRGGVPAFGQSITIGIVDMQRALDAHPRKAASERALQEFFAAKQREFRERSKAMTAEQRQLLDRELQQQVLVKRQELLGGLDKEIRTVIEDVAKTQGVAIVLERSVVLFGGVDLTDQGIQKGTGKERGGPAARRPAPAGGAGGRRLPGHRPGGPVATYPQRDPRRRAHRCRRRGDGGAGSPPLAGTGRPDQEADRRGGATRHAAAALAGGPGAHRCPPAGAGQEAGGGIPGGGRGTAGAAGGGGGGGRGPVGGGAGGEAEPAAGADRRGIEERDRRAGDHAARGTAAVRSAGAGGVPLPHRQPALEDGRGRRGHRG